MIARPGVALLVAVLATAVGPAVAVSAQELSGPSATVATARADTDVASSPAFTNLKSCLAQRRQGDLVLMIDTSASLAQGDENVPPSDPDAVRVDAAKLLLNGLSTTMAEGQIALDVAIAGFDADVAQVVDFTPLTAERLPELQSAVDGFAERDTGRETDYWSALNWINTSLHSRQQARGAAPGCQLAIWFTDGEFDLSGSSGAVEQPPVPGEEETLLNDSASADAVQSAAATELCRVGGPADQMRLAGITLIAAGLGPRAADYTQNGFSLRSYTENPDGTCGAQPGTGLFIPVGSVSDLVFAFDELANPNGHRDQPDPKKLCQQTACAEGTYPFTLDDTLDVVHVAAVLDDAGKVMDTDGIAVQLTGPGGADPLVISGDGNETSGTGMVADATVDYHWYQRGELTLDLRHPAGTSWAGNWTLTFVDLSGTHPDAVSRIQLTLTSDLQVVPEVSATPWRAGGQSGEITFHAERLDGTPVPAESISANNWTTHATLTFAGYSKGDDPSTAAIDVPVDLTAPTTVPLPDSMHSGAWEVKIALGLSLAGEPLPDVVRQAPVSILPPLSNPTLAQTDQHEQQLDFDTIEGTAAVTRTVVVVGPSDGDGCVWLTDGTLGTTPPSVTSVTVSSTAGSAADCMTVPQSQSRNLDVTLAPGSAGNGPLTGTVQVHLAPVGNPERASVADLSYSAQLIRPAQQTVTWIVLAIVMLIGIGIPLLVLILVRWLAARFPSNVRLQYTIVDVRCGPDGIRMSNGDPLLLGSLSWRSVAEPTGGGHSLALGPVTLRAKAGWNLSAPGFADVEQPAVGLCGAAPHFDSRRHRPRLPLAIQGTWTLIFAPTESMDPPGPVGQLLLVVAAGLGDGERQGLLNKVGRDAPGLLASLRRSPPTGPHDTDHGDGALVPAAGPPANPFEAAPGGTDTGFGLRGGDFGGGFGAGSGPGPGFGAGGPGFTPYPRAPGANPGQGRESDSPAPPGFEENPFR